MVSNWFVRITSKLAYYVLNFTYHTLLHGKHLHWTITKAGISINICNCSRYACRDVNDILFLTMQNQKFWFSTLGVFTEVYWTSNASRPWKCTDSGNDSNVYGALYSVTAAESPHSKTLHRHRNHCYCHPPHLIFTERLSTLSIGTRFSNTRRRRFSRSYILTAAYLECVLMTTCSHWLGAKRCHLPATNHNTSIWYF